MIIFLLENESHFPGFLVCWVILDSILDIMNTVLRLVSVIVHKKYGGLGAINLDRLKAQTLSPKGSSSFDLRSVLCFAVSSSAGLFLVCSLPGSLKTGQRPSIYM